MGLALIHRLVRVELLHWMDLLLHWVDLLLSKIANRKRIIGRRQMVCSS